MRILAIETIEMTGSVCTLVDDRVLAERRLEAGQRSAQSLAPGIAAVLDGSGWLPSDVDLVAVATGPGSFTGLRIGVTTAKTLAYAIGCEAIGIHTFAAVAAQAPADVARVTTVLDAQRNELYVADFHRSPQDAMLGEETTRIVRAADWLAGLTAGTTVTGPGLAKLLSRLPEGMRVVEASQWSPVAAAIGKLGWRAFSGGRRDPVFDLMPAYFRRTAAEEQWDRKQSS